MKKTALILLMSVFTFLVIKGYSQCTHPVPITDPGCTTNMTGYQNSFNMMNIPCAWTISQGDPGVVVAVLDCYFDRDHVDLAGKIEHIYYGDNCENSQNESCTHGTSSLGAIAALANGMCVQGAGGHIRVAGFCESVTPATIKNAVDRGYKIIYLAVTLSLDASVAQYAVDNGATLILANRGGYWKGIDNIPGVIKVGLTYHDGTFDHYTNDDPMETGIDVFTVGSYEMGGSCKLVNGNGCTEAGGSTSLSAGYIAGIVGLMRSVNPCLTPAEIEHILEITAGPIPNFPLSQGGGPLPAGTAEHGIVNAYEAVKMARDYAIHQDETWIADGQEITAQTHVTGHLNIVNQTAPYFKTITIDGSLSMDPDKDLVIHSGVHLIVRGTIMMGDQGRIIVKRGAKLEVASGVRNSATLRNSPCSPSWQGIIIEGNANKLQPSPTSNIYALDDAGIAIIDGAAIINARTAVSMNPSHLPWPHAQYYGGYLVASNAHFNDNHRAVEFMRYLYQDKSTLTACTINGYRGTTHWANEGVAYNGNTFTTEKDGIYAFDAQIVVNGCTFHSSDVSGSDYASVCMYYSAPESTLNGSYIYSNYFYGGDKGVEKAGGYSENTNFILKNLFFAHNKSMSLDGYSSCEIQYNDISGAVWGNYLTRLGSGEINASDNLISSYDYGISAYFNCGGFNFTNNCFALPNSGASSPSVQVVGFGQDTGYIRGIIAVSDNTAAGNCFDYGASWGGKILDFQGSHKKYNYYYKDTTGCRRKPFVVNTTRVTEQQATLNCGSIVGNPINTGFTCVIKSSDPTQILLQISQLGVQYGAYQDSLRKAVPNSANWYKYKLRLLQIEACIKKLKSLLTKVYAETKAYTALKKAVAADAFHVKAGVIGEMIRLGDFAEALSYMDEMIVYGEEQQDFITAQRLFIHKRIDPSFIMDTVTKRTLYNAAMKPYPLNVYSKTVYTFLTGEKILYNPHLLLPAHQREKIDTVQIKPTSVHVYPNPFDNTISIESDIINASYTMTTIDGLVAMSGRIDDNVTTIATHTLKNGIYIITLYDPSGHIILIEKLVK